MDFDNRPYDIEKKKDKSELAKYWDIAIGLQATDGLKTSEYLVSLSKENISGQKSYDTVINELKEYHTHTKFDDRTKEADFSSTRIAEILSTDAFTLSPATLQGYHERLFKGIDEFAHPIGEFRDANITKPEEVLDWYSVNYADHNDILRLLKWEFAEEKDKNYTKLDKKQILNNVTKFMSTIWQIHPFREGNTRTVAVFTLKYMRTLGFNTTNQPFQEHARYFRDALVLANAYNQYHTGEFLHMFMENAFLFDKHALCREDMLRKIH